MERESRVSNNLTPTEREISDKVNLSLEHCPHLYGYLGVLERIAELSNSPAYSHPILEAVEKIKKLDHV